MPGLHGGVRGEVHAGKVGAHRGCVVHKLLVFLKVELPGGRDVDVRPVRRGGRESDEGRT